MIQRKNNDYRIARVHRAGRRPGATRCGAPRRHAAGLPGYAARAVSGTDLDEAAAAAVLTEERGFVPRPEPVGRPGGDHRPGPEIAWGGLALPPGPAPPATCRRGCGPGPGPGAVPCRARRRRPDDRHGRPGRHPSAPGEPEQVTIPAAAARRATWLPSRRCRHRWRQNLRALPVPPGCQARDAGSACQVLPQRHRLRRAGIRLAHVRACFRRRARPGYRRSCRPPSGR
jgi:hypothetical protein